MLRAMAMSTDIYFRMNAAKMLSVACRFKKEGEDSK